MYTYIIMMIIIIMIIIIGEENSIGRLWVCRSSVCHGVSEGFSLFSTCANMLPINKTRTTNSNYNNYYYHYRYCETRLQQKPYRAEVAPSAQEPIMNE